MIQNTVVLVLIAVNLSVVLSGHCSSEKDQNAVIYMNNNRGIETECLLRCVGFEWCMTSCYEKLGFSRGCAQCFSGADSCMLRNCPILHLGKQKKDCEFGCELPFDECTGDIPQPNALTADQGEGACTNPSDSSILESQKTSLSSKILSCTFKCFGSASCSKKCLISSTKLSEGCTDCFVDDISCTVKNCAPSCVGGLTKECTDCRGKNCDNSFEMCSGVSIPTN